MTIRSVPGMAATAAVLSGLALSACTSPTQSAAPAPPSATAQLTSPQLKSRLLTAGNLPSGYGSYAVSDDAPDSSDKPACLAALNSLSGYSPPPAAVTEASAAFAASQTGPWVLE